MDKQNTHKPEFPPTPPMEVWDYDDDISMPIYLGLLAFVLVAAPVFGFIQAV